MQDYLLDLDFELRDNFKVIKTTYNLLNSTSDLKIPTHAAGQWLLDNMYIIESEYNIVKEDFRHMVSAKLPLVKPTEQKTQIRIMFMAREMVEKNYGIIDDGIVSNYVREFYKNAYLTYAELSYLPVMLRAALIKYIKTICVNILNAEMQKLKVERRINSSAAKDADNLSSETIKSLGKLKSDLVISNKVKTNNTAYIEYMAYRLKDMGRSGEDYLQELKEETSKVGFSVDEAIEKEHSEIAKTTSLMANSVSSMKTIATTNWGEVIVAINRIDEILLDDFTNEYRRCDHKTKKRYRDTVIKLANKYKYSEMYVAKKALECSQQFEKHIGHFLIGNDKVQLIKSLKKSTFSTMFYERVIKPLLPINHIFMLTMISAFITLLGDYIFIHNYSITYRVILDILLFIISSEVADKLVTYIVGKFVTPSPLPRFNFAKTIDEENSTMIAMPTVVNSKEKIDKMIRKMEVTYLANRSENMYYMLLGDCVSKKVEHEELDEELFEYGKQKIEELNNKYPSNIKLFNYIYRKRVFSKGENCFMGWERKRGALTQLNLLLLNKLTTQEKQAAFYIAIDEIPKVKYVITIDEDTALSLNSAKELVAIISHPLNKPILSKNGRIVKSGYGLIQPAIGLDIESANTSIFSKVFGGFGGLDIYTNATSNIYQDVFGEAIYTGKGIYDIEMFDKLIGNKVPENLILSHDLLEGSYMRTGLASDVEVQDGFPANFIAYMKRNHRWYRGDMQIISWLFRFNSGLNLLSRWKIFDNLRREMLPIWSIVFMVVASLLGVKELTGAVIALFVAFNFGYILSIFDQIIFGRNAERKQKQYIPVIYGIRANLLKMVENIITLPYKAWVVLNAYVTSLYRMLISKKNLLEWATAETVEKNAKDSFGYFIKKMWPNLFIGVAIILYAVLYNMTWINASDNIFLIVFGAFILLAPYGAYIMSKRVIFEKTTRLSEKENKDVIEIARRTWNFFDVTMIDINNYLPPDNFQENRRPKIAARTSSTNIGYGLLAIANAYDLSFISLDKAIEKIENVFCTIDKLDKWNGHLYNWYNIRTLEPLRPRFVSTVDSGNFVASLYVVKQFLEEVSTSMIVIDNIKQRIKRLVERIDEYIINTDFKKLYVKSKNVFTIGYDIESGKMVDSYYDMLMSESRLTSLVAIAQSNVTTKHWFALSRNLVKVDGMKGLLSWSGTSFEYFMPNIFTKTYKYTLIDESLSFALNSQIKYSKSVGVPWGISESAFAVQDNEQNYQYKAFGIPWLGLKRGLNDNMVVSPYSSLICLPYSPKKVYANLKNLKKYNAYSTYGFYEAIDFTKQHIASDKKYELVKTYMAHHQGMILCGINNYINSNILQNRFHANANIDAAEILLKERIPLSVPIKENRYSKENKYVVPQKDEYTSHIAYLIDKQLENSERSYVAMHTNGKLSTTILDNGKNYMYFKQYAISKNRYMSNETFGNKVIITDKSTVKIWSATKEPQFITPDNYSVSFALADTQFVRKDGEIETTMRVTISPEYNMEIRKITLLNLSKERKEIVINTELELAMSEERANIVHPAFNSLLIEEYYDENLKALIARKRPKNDNNENKDEFFVYTKLVGIDLPIEIETEKSKLIQNGGKDAYDNVIVRYPLSPVLSYRATLFLDPNEVQSFYYIVGASDTKYGVSHAIVNCTPKTIEEQIKFAIEKENISAKYLKLKPGKVLAYNEILSKALFDNEFTKKLNSKFWGHKYTQSMLWKYSISGDLPIITVKVGRIEDASMLSEVIHFMDYVKSRKINVDVVMLVDEELYSGEPIKNHLQDMLKHVVFMTYTSGNIYVVNIKSMTEEEQELFDFVSRYSIEKIEEFMPKKLNKKEKEIVEEEINE